MVVVGAILKYLYPKLFHETCVAHLLHNRAMKVEHLFEDVDLLIAKIKSAKVKNKTRQAKFNTIALRSQSINACHSLLSEDGEAGKMLPHIIQRVYLK